VQLHGGRDRLPLLRLSDPGGSVAIMFALGGTQGLVTMALPHWRVAHPSVVVAVAAAAVALAPILWLVRERMPMRGCQLLLAIGSAAISLGALASGPNPGSTSTAYFYFWVPLYAAVYFRPRTAAAHVAGAALLYALALALDPTPAFVSQWMQTVTTMTVTGLVIGGFARQARHVAHTDSLTGLPNRRGLDERLPRVVQQQRRKHGDGQLCVAVLDLDDFKQVNDTQGHEAGDAILHYLGDTWRSVLRPADVLARLGGDEFLLVTPDSDAEGAAALVQRLRGFVRAPLGVSAGIAVMLADEGTAELVGRADAAMYAAKVRGKGATVVAGPVRALTHRLIELTAPPETAA